MNGRDLEKIRAHITAAEKALADLPSDYVYDTRGYPLRVKANLDIANAYIRLGELAKR